MVFDNTQHECFVEHFDQEQNAIDWCTGRLEVEDKHTPNTVDLIASGYQWICPKCKTHNKEIEITEEVTCENCDTKFELGDYHHAIG